MIISNTWCFYMLWKLGTCIYLFVFMWQKGAEIAHCSYSIFAIFFVFCWLLVFMTIQPSANVALTIVFFLNPLCLTCKWFEWTTEWWKLICCFNITYCNLISFFFFFFLLSELCDVYGGNVLRVNLISTIHWHAGLTC